MRVEVVCFGMFREHLPTAAEGNRALLELHEGAAVSDLVRALGIPEGQVFALLVGGERADVAQVLQEGDEVTLMPPFSGGRRP